MQFCYYYLKLHAYTQTHSNSLTHSLTHSHTHTHTHTRTLSLTHPHTHSLTQSFNHSFTYSFTHSSCSLYSMRLYIGIYETQTSYDWLAMTRLVRLFGYLMHLFHSCTHPSIHMYIYASVMHACHSLSLSLTR